MSARRCLLLVVVAALLTPWALAKNVKIRGYVTVVTSPTNFEIEDYHIARDQGLALSFEKSDAPGAPSFRPEDIRVGTDLEISGEYDEKTGELRAQSVKVFQEEAKKIKRSAVIELLPSIEKTPEGWKGTFFADGQRIRLQPSTVLVFKPNRLERKAMGEAAKAAGKKPAGDDDEDAYTRPVQSLEEIHPNMLLTYEGYRQEDGGILADRLEFMRNETEPAEARLWQQLAPTGKYPDYEKFRPGELLINGVGKFKLVPSREAQGYIQQLGLSLVPTYQKALPDGDPTKLAFKFFLVEEKEPNAFALANGTVVVNSGLFEVLVNEAQLASVLSHEIAHAIQKHTWRQHEYHKGSRTALKIGGILAGAATGQQAITELTNMIEGAIRNGYARSLENQADRLGLEYMYAAGYDIREAPRVWKLMSMKYGDRSSNSFWSNHDNNTTRRSYLMAEIRNNYADADFSKLEKGQFPLAPMAAKIQDPSGKKIKVKY